MPFSLVPFSCIYCRVPSKDDDSTVVKEWLKTTHNGRFANRLPDVDGRGLHSMREQRMADLLGNEDDAALLYDLIHDPERTNLNNTNQ